MDPIITIIFALVVIVYVGLMIQNPRLAIYLLCFFSIFDLGFFSRWFEATRYIARIPLLLACLLGLIFVIKFFSGKLKIRSNDEGTLFTIKFVFSMFCLALFSGLYNSESLLLGIFELRYFFMLVVFVICFNYYLPHFMTVKKFIIFCVIVGLIQIPFTALQYILVEYVGIRLSQSALDMSSGAFSTYTTLVFFQCVAIASVLEYQINFQKPLLKVNNYLVVILLTIPLLLSYSRAAMGFVVLIILLSPVKS
jgi:hypothetical protein